jgi:hypothetical protein
MKSKFILTIALLSLFAACKHDDALPSGNDDNQYIFGVTRVLSVEGTDTTSTRFIGGRVETDLVLASDEDSKMRAELIGYQYLGSGKALYNVRAINKTDCQSIVRWHWIGGLLVDSIVPLNDNVLAHDTTMFLVYGTATVGAITLNAQAHDPTSCGNSRTLQLNITTGILPSKFTTSSVKRQGDKMIVKFSDETPPEKGWYFVMWSPTGNPVDEVVKNMFVSDANVKSYTTSFPAVKKDGK